MNTTSPPVLALLGILAAFHLVHLVWAVPPAAFRFRRSRRRWHWVDARAAGTRLSGGRRLCWSAVSPLTPVALLESPGYRLEVDGVVIDPDGRLPEAAPTAAVVRIPYEALSPSRDRAWLILRPDVRVLCASPAAAALAVEALQGLATAAPEARPGLARALLTSRLAPEAAAGRLALWLRARRPLAWASLLGGLAAYGAVGALALGLWRGEPLWSLPLAWGVILAAVQVTRWRAHRALFPDDRRGRRLGALALFISPAEALTVPQALGREVLAGHHPLGLARAVGDEASFRGLASRFLRGARSSGAALEVEVLSAWLADQGVDPEALLAAPVPAEGTTAWCPRCHGQFTTLADPCPECLGASLLPWPEGTATPDL